jgi:protein-histidine pros-kinase
MSERVFRSYSGSSADWNDEKLRAFLEAAPDAIVVVDDTGTILAVNELTARMFGYSRDALVRRRVEMLVPDRYRRIHMAHRAEYADDPRTRAMGAGRALTGQKSDGSEFPIEISLSPYVTASGTAVISIIRDLTDRLRAETKFRGFLESAPDAVVVTDLAGKIAVVNPLAEKMFGYTRDELLGEPVQMLVPDVAQADHPFLWDEATAAARGASGTPEVACRRKDGTEFTVEISRSSLDIEQGTLTIAIIRDTTLKKQAEAKFRSLMESAPDAIVVVDSNGGIRIVNSQTERMFGYSRRELLDQPVTMLVPYNDRPNEPGEHLLGRRKDGREFPVEISLSLLHTEEGTLVTSIIRDVTDRVRAEDERRTLEAAQMRAEEMSRAKDQFLMTLSHELRTPLTAILGWSTMLSMDPLSSHAMNPAIDAIHNGAVVQARIIDDVLEMSNLIEGRIALNVEMTDPVAIARAAVQVVKPVADSKRVRIMTEIRGEISLLSADPARLQQIVVNLLSNAIKFSAKDSAVTLSIDQPGSKLEITVQDSGEGIPRKFLPYVFEPFLQADSSTTRTHTGLGLGLSIVRHLVELHGGEILATSPGVGQGSEFRVTFPVRAATETTPLHPAGTSASVPRSYPNLSGTTVLCVDDDADSRALLRAVLEHAGATVRTASSADEALHDFDAAPADVVITDIAMPKTDGFELCDRLRQRSTVPILALSALTRLEDRDPDDKRFVAFLRKPAEPAVIAWAVARAVGRGA